MYGVLSQLAQNEWSKMMFKRHRVKYFLPFSSLLLILVLLLGACGSSPSATSGSNSSSSSKTLTNVSIGLGYIPDIQFAPFYVAQEKGYYKDAGLNVTLQNGIVTDLIGSMVLGHSTLVFASGDEVMVARSKNLPVIDVSSIYQQYPVSLIVPANSPIHSLADFKGHTIGEPGPYGATHTGLLALLHAGHLSLSDVHMQEIGFTQVAALLGHKVDAVVGYSNNEPLQLEQHGFPVRTFNVSDYQPMVSNGIITTQQTYQSQPQMVKNFVAATMKGVKDVIANPAAAVQISKSFIPGLNTTQALTVLKATIPILQGNGKLGYNDPATWQAMVQFLVDEKIIPSGQNVSQAYTNIGS
jgi:NitT/TauT family transport system substrate-binding protein